MKRILRYETLPGLQRRDQVTARNKSLPAFSEAAHAVKELVFENHFRRDESDAASLVDVSPRTGEVATHMLIEPLAPRCGERSFHGIS